MRSSNVADIQKEFYKYLSYHLEIPVENKIDLDTPMPFLGMDVLQGERLNARGLEGFEVRQTLVVYSHFDGKDEVINFTDEIRNLLIEEPFEMEEWNVHTADVERFYIEQIKANTYEAEIIVRMEVYDY